ncbi:MAG: SDR family NAD(P)-dependent oxidoreductase, partial [Planctomycetes bacterium]|nr:SDR family NAD(P)-dependent oxidoreductase [Planctomycetota bacterium]
MVEPRRVLVTGASSGIGAATVRAFHEAGWEVWACARRQERLDQLVEAFPDRLHVFQLDVRDRSAVESSLSQLPLPAVLVNNAGLSRGLEPLWEGKPSDWDEMLDTNVKGLLHVTRVLLGRMVVEGAGHIINIGSIAGQEAYPNGAVYC